MGLDTYSTKISVLKAPTRGGSANRHSRAERYCFCDKAYSILDDTRKRNLETWWKKVSEKRIVSMTNHSVLMKICLKYLEEFTAYRHFAVVQRYSVANESDVPYTSKSVLFSDIETYQEDGEDCEAYLLLGGTTKKGTITYDRLMIDTRLERDIPSRGSAMVLMPEIRPWTRYWVDVYSYYRVLPNGS